MRWVLLLILLVFVAGCIDGITFGEDVIKVSEDRTEETNDILVIKDVMLIPDSPIPPSTYAILSFVIENTDKWNEASNVRVSLFDAPGFDVTGPDECRVACRILPGGNKLVSFNLKAPSYDKIAGLITEMDLKFMIEYDFTGKTQYDAVVVTLDEIKTRQRSGKSIEIESQYVLGSGPIKIEVETESSFVISGMDYEPRFIFTLRNKGGGSAKDLKINEMKIRFPEEFSNPTPASDEYFSCSRNICDLKKEITLYKDKSLPLIFSVSVNRIDGPYKTAQIYATADYTYELRDSKRVTIRPLGV